MSNKESLKKIDELNEVLQREIERRKYMSDKIKQYTDKWVQVQKNIIDIKEDIVKLK